MYFESAEVQQEGFVLIDGHGNPFAIPLTAHPDYNSKYPSLMVNFFNGKIGYLDPQNGEIVADKCDIFSDDSCETCIFSFRSEFKFVSDGTLVMNTREELQLTELYFISRETGECRSQKIYSPKFRAGPLPFEYPIKTPISISPQ